MRFLAGVIHPDRQPSQLTAAADIAVAYVTDLARAEKFSVLEQLAVVWAELDPEPSLRPVGQTVRQFGVRTKQQRQQAPRAVEDLQTVVSSNCARVARTEWKGFTTGRRGTRDARRH